MESTLYHGSKEIITRPRFGFGSLLSDYGQGFYTTPDEPVTRLWASKYDGGGYVNQYRFSSNHLSILDLSTIEENDVMSWITLLVNHRFTAEELDDFGPTIKKLLAKYSIPLEKYDVIKGFRSDDNYFSYASGFLSGLLSYGKLVKAMRIGNLGVQIVFLSKESFSHLRFEGAEKIEANHQYMDFQEKTLAQYQSLIQEDEDNPIFIQDILRS